MEKNKKILKKISYKIFCFTLLALFSISCLFINVKASGIEYGEEDTIFTFDLNRGYLDFIDNNFPSNFSYYFTLPISFSIAGTNYNNLHVNITNGVVGTIWVEGLSNLGTPYDIYLVESGVWKHEELLTELAFEYGIEIKEQYIYDLYNFNFQYDNVRDFDNYIPRFYKYTAVNNLLKIKLNTFRFKSDLLDIVENNDSTFYNISMVYIEQGVDNLKMIGYTIGGSLVDQNGVNLSVSLPKISFLSNNEKYNEMELITSFDNTEPYESYMTYNNLKPYDIEYSTPWLNNNYKFLTLYNDIGLMDYLNLSIYGDFNVSQFWVDPDTDATFNDLFTGIANVPIIVLSNLLSFSVFGWTAFAVLTGIVTLLVIIWLIRKLTH